MGCITSTRAPKIEQPTHLKKNGDDPFSIQWNDNSGGEEGYIIYCVTYPDSTAPEYWERIEHVRIGPDAEDYSFRSKTCEIAELYGSRDHLEVQVAAYLDDVIKFSEMEVVMSRRARPSDGGESPLENPLNLRVSQNPCIISWEYSGVGFYECAREEEEGFRIFMRVYPEENTPNLNDEWINVATVGKNVRSHSFNQLCDNVLPIGYGENLWAYIEVFSDVNLHSELYQYDEEPESDFVLIYHSETPTLYPLDPAQFHEVIWPQSVVGATVSGDDPFAPEEINFDGVHETENIYQSYKSNVVTRGEHPYIKITGESNNTASQTKGEIIYWIQLSPLSHDVDFHQEVRLIIETQGYASVSDTKSKSTATASISTLGAYYDNTTYITACSSPGVPNPCLDPPYSELDIQYSFNVDLDFNNIIQVRMVAHLYLGHLGSGEVEILEPIIRIDPNQMIDGTPANELYEILYSDGILPPTT